MFYVAICARHTKYGDPYNCVCLSNSPKYSTIVHVTLSRVNGSLCESDFQASCYLNIVHDIVKLKTGPYVKVNFSLIPKFSYSHKDPCST